MDETAGWTEYLVPAAERDGGRPGKGQVVEGGLLALRILLRVFRVFGG